MHAVGHQREYIYSEVIRVWDIVLDHGNLHRRIEHVSTLVKNSNSRGRDALLQIPLTMPSKPTQSTTGQEVVRLPQKYVYKDFSKPEVLAQTQYYIPAASTEDKEYKLVTFYSFNSTFVKSMLDGSDARRDFPFKEWPQEHDIINMKQGESSILLLGRSGTGKTTCCLYRLWNHFQNYWSLAIIGGRLVPWRSLVTLQSKDEVAVGQKDCAYRSQRKEIMEKSEHYHQVFITKNPVLCSQVKRQFYDLAAGRDFAKEHMDYEGADLPSSLTEVDDHAFPLFLTARDFFILLDNSLGDGKNFFQRDSSGRLIEKIISSDYDQDDPDKLLDDIHNEVLDHNTSPQLGAVAKKKLPEQFQRVVTASYFVDKVWPKISKKQDKLAPLLAWMEIKSFIKGSVGALEKECGYLSLEEYENMGRKVAPNYINERQEIYTLFERYIHMKSHCENKLFDESDLVHSINSRLNALKDLSWSIHSIYVDEVQDFTQAELMVLMRICRNPNDLFLTGDTAQSIMKGVSFRFSDLRSIFHHVSKSVYKSSKTNLVGIPELQKLTINFRSHAGVLKLAASVIELMQKFFPSSFDLLPEDSGMFPGPIPIVLECDNVSNLALILRANKPESSVIEFGAHQVIIVQSEEAKKSIPDTLKGGIILTVFEAKGLEFNDVLLYDFFKDSIVSYSAPSLESIII